MTGALCMYHNNIIIITTHSPSALHQSTYPLRSTTATARPTGLLGLLHPFNGLFYRTTWVSRYQKGETSLHLKEARDNGVLGWQWHQLDHMQTICTSFQTGHLAVIPTAVASGFIAGTVRVADKDHQGDAWKLGITTKIQHGPKQPRHEIGAMHSENQHKHAD